MGSFANRVQVLVKRQVAKELKVAYRDLVSSLSLTTHVVAAERKRRKASPASNGASLARRRAGEYMAASRSLSQPKKLLVRQAREKDGIVAAIKLAKELREKIKKEASA